MTKASLHVMKKDSELKKERETAEKAIQNANRVPILAGLPEYLKDRANYPKIQKALLETLASTHSHSDIIEWGACVPCQRRIKDHADMVRKLGFTSPAQYYAWKKVHEEIVKRVPLR